MNNWSTHRMCKIKVNYTMNDKELIDICRKITDEFSRTANWSIGSVAKNLLQQLKAKQTQATI